MFLCAIFLSDLASANGWYFDSTRCSREVDHNGDSTYSFPREKPSQKDWEEWEAMWRRYCQRDGSFPVHLGHIQYSHLLNAKSVMSMDDWISVFISKLLHITHGQWIYRNISKHHDELGSIRRTERRQLLLKIDRLIHLPPEAVPEESKFLLEVDFARLRQGELTSQHYWVYAVKAAVGSAYSFWPDRCS
jgi:hypothetical protein